MSVLRAIEVRCDGPNCHEAWTDYGTAGEMREAMRLHGWRNVGRQDFCPDHPAAPEEADPA